MLIFAVDLIIGVTSCESDYSKESNGLIQEYQVALTEQNLQESKRLSDILESRELNSTQTAKVQSSNKNLSDLEQAEKQRERREKHFNGHDYVDLGLPSGLLWATCNIGADSPSSFGSYYAWGETSTKTKYSRENYTYKSSPNTLPLSVDAAAVNWGGGWRMPKKREVEELLEVCVWESVDKDGLKLTGPNGQSIFFPAGGIYRDSYLDLKGVCGCYWTSTFNDRPSEIFENLDAYFLFVNSRYGYSFYGSISSMPRYNGYTIRAVCSPIK